MTEPGNGSAFDLDQYQAIYPEGVERHYWNRCRNRVIASMLRRCNARGPMLEVGCGKGLVVASLCDRGFDVQGVDIAKVEPIPAVTGHVRTGVDAMEIPADEAKLYRTLLLLDVIEHLEDPVGFIGSLLKKFTGVERVILTVPARQELFSNYDRFNRHHRRYDLLLLRSHLAPVGLRGWKASYFFHLLYPAAWTQLKIKGERPLAFKVPGKGLPDLIHRLIGYALYLEYLILPASLFGTSIVACADVRDQQAPV